MSQIETPVTQLPIPAEPVDRLDHGPGRGRHGPGRGGAGGGGWGPNFWARGVVDIRHGQTFGLVFGLIASTAWLGVCLAYVASYVGWGALVYLLPHELADMLSAVFAPLGVMWLMLFYLRRGSEFAGHAADLQAELRRLTYPDEQAETRIEMISTALRRQADELTRASEQATDQVRQVETLLRQRVDDIGRASTSSNARTAALVEELGGRARALESAADRLSQQGGQINDLLTDQAGDFGASITQSQNRAADVVTTLNDQSDALAEAMDRAEARTERLTENTMSQADRLGQHYDNRLTAMDQAAVDAQQTISERANSLADGLSRAVDDLDQKFGQSMDHMDHRSSTWSEEAMARADQVRLHYGARLNEIEQTGQKTQTMIADRSAQMAADLQDNLAHVESDFDTTINRLTVNAGVMTDNTRTEADEILANFEARLGDLDQGADDAQAALAARGEEMARKLSGNLHNMSGSFDQNLAQMNQAGITMTEAARDRADQMHHHYGERLAEIEQQSARRRPPSPARMSAWPTTWGETSTP